MALKILTKEISTPFSNHSAKELDFHTTSINDIDHEDLKIQKAGVYYRNGAYRLIYPSHG